MRSEDAALRVLELIERLGRVVSGENWGDGLNPTQRAALAYLARANRFSRRPSAVAAYLAATKGTVSQTLQALERKGFAQRIAAESDGRAAYYQPTAEGLRALEGRRASLVALETMQEASLALLASELDEALRAMLAARGGRAFGVCRSCCHFQERSPEGAPHRCALLGAPLSAEDSLKICWEHEPSRAHPQG